MILLADDSPHARHMGSEYLADLGYQVVTASDGATALSLLNEQGMELILVDAALPGMPEASLPEQLGGMALCRRIKSNPAWSSIPVLVLLGAMARTSPRELAGADGVLRKPLSSAGLERWLQQLAARALSPKEMLERAVRAAALRGIAREE